MNITAQNFRDKIITQLSVSYDWNEANSFVTITMLGSDGSSHCYRISGLSEFTIYEDFGCMTITQCKLLQSHEGIYLSLDPFNEFGPIDEKDNFCFRGKSIESISSIC